MDAQERTRSCFRERMPRSEGTPRGSKQICIPMTADIYHRIWNDAGQVRQFLEPLIKASPEQRFPERTLLACANVLAAHDLCAGFGRHSRADLRDAGDDSSAGGGSTLGGTWFAAIG